MIPWYELAIRRDFKRQSCPPISGSGVGGAVCGSLTLAASPQEELEQVMYCYKPIWCSIIMII